MLSSQSSPLFNSSAFFSYGQLCVHCDIYDHRMHMHSHPAHALHWWRWAILILVVVIVIAVVIAVYGIFCIATGGCCANTSWLLPYMQKQLLSMRAVVLACCICWVALPLAYPGPCVCLHNILYNALERSLPSGELSHLVHQSQQGEQERILPTQQLQPCPYRSDGGVVFMGQNGCLSTFQHGDN